jgi:DNA-binding beta-propeller fold protein YncE
MRRPLRLVLPFAAAAALTTAGCTFTSNATHWNGRVAPDGKPVYVTTTTVYGCNICILWKMVGDTRSDALVAATTARIAQHGSDHVRVVETESANWWYTIPPLTWLFTPVMGSVSIEYTPSAAELAARAGAVAKP